MRRALLFDPSGCKTCGTSASGLRTGTGGGSLALGCRSGQAFCFALASATGGSAGFAGPCRRLLRWRRAAEAERRRALRGDRRDRRHSAAIVPAKAGSDGRVAANRKTDKICSWQTTERSADGRIRVVQEGHNVRPGGGGRGRGLGANVRSSSGVRYGLPDGVRLRRCHGRVVGVSLDVGGGGRARGRSRSRSTIRSRASVHGVRQVEQKRLRQATCKAKPATETGAETEQKSTAVLVPGRSQYLKRRRTRAAT